MTVVSNTSPLRYLIAVGRPDLIQKIFGQVLIPRAVEEELIHPSASPAIRKWIAEKPEWLEVQVRPTRRHDRLLVRCGAVVVTELHRER